MPEISWIPNFFKLKKRTHEFYTYNRIIAFIKLNKGLKLNKTRNNLKNEQLILL